ncbi:MAG: hypothetical protein JO253_02890 [Alphaproteobacteria bacterium]|nr:hypothetical protein [Alphaproteobacteria bacterium]
MLTSIIPSYLYLQYKDDADLQASVDAYNTLAQEYMDWFTQANLPDYTGPVITDTLLDWVAQGLYGIKRPALMGNALVTDDIFKRVISWHFFKADGKVFDVRWLKRRLQRFLMGTNGTGKGINQTYQISVRFAGSRVVNINIFTGIGYVQGGAMFNTGQFNTWELNDIKLIIREYVDTTLAPILQAAINAGVVELPFEYSYNVSIAP